MRIKETMILHGVLLASVLVSSVVNAATVNLNPIADGSVTENGDGLIFVGGVNTTDSSISATMSGPLSSTAVFEFDLSGFSATNVTAARFVVTQAGTALFGGGQTTLQLDGYGGDGVVTAADIHPAFNAASETDPPVNILASMTPDHGTPGARFDERSFVLDVGELFAQVGGGGLLTLRLVAFDTDNITSLAVFSNESTTVDFDIILPGVQGGVPTRLELTTVPLPAGLPLLLGGLGGLLVRYRRGHSKGRCNEVPSHT